MFMTETKRKLCEISIQNQRIQRRQDPLPQFILILSRKKKHLWTLWTYYLDSDPGSPTCRPQGSIVIMPMPITIVTNTSTTGGLEISRDINRTNHLFNHVLMRLFMGTSALALGRILDFDAIRKQRADLALTETM
jgi:hypothetical protein